MEDINGSQEDVLIGSHQFGVACRSSIEWKTIGGSRQFLVLAAGFRTGAFGFACCVPPSRVSAGRDEGVPRGSAQRKYFQGYRETGVTDGPADDVCTACVLCGLDVDCGAMRVVCSCWGHVVLVGGWGCVGAVSKPAPRLQAPAVAPPCRVANI